MENKAELSGRSLSSTSTKLMPCGCKDPLHGVTLKMIVTFLVEKYGWEELSRHVSINCFKKEPSVSSSLKFLRKTPWARKKVESLYIESQSKVEHNIWLKRSKAVKSK